MDQTTNEMKTIFDSKMEELIAKKNKNTQIFSKAAYIEMIEKIEKAKQMTTGKKPGDYARLKKYDVECKDGVKKLIVPMKQEKQPTEDPLYYVHTEEIFKVLHTAHLKTSHGGRHRMIQENIKKYKNVTREMISLYLSLCKSCEEKRNSKNELMKRAHVIRMSYFYFIDMPEDNEYKFIFVHVDYFTKFIQLRPSKTKSAQETAVILTDIYAIFGPSESLQCGLGKEFCEEVANELCKLWPCLFRVDNFITLTSSTEINANLIRKMIDSRLQLLKTNKWAKELQMVQLANNQMHCNEIKCTPFRAMFMNTNIIDTRKRSIDDMNPNSQEETQNVRDPECDSDLSDDGLLEAKKFKTINFELSSTSNIEEEWELKDIKTGVYSTMPRNETVNVMGYQAMQMEDVENSVHVEVKKEFTCQNTEIESYASDSTVKIEIEEHNTWDTSLL